jgi:hypothetical protein
VKVLKAKALVLATLISIASFSPVSAHQPLSLTTAAAKVATSPVIVDGAISFAVTANFTKAGEKRYFRLVLTEGQEFSAEYLILNEKPTNALTNSKLPKVTIITPSGKNLAMKITERTAFFEPWGKKNYFYLSRLNRAGEAGVYTVVAEARVRSSIVIATGKSEVRGEVLSIGNKAGTCPAAIKNENEVSELRAKQLIGLTEKSGEICATLNNWGYRVVARDGEDFAVTMDYRSNRVNVKIQSDQIVSVTVG